MLLVSINTAAFDTNSELFYYDAEKKKSDVAIMNSPYSLKEFLDTYAGVKGVYTNLPESLWENVWDESVRTNCNLVFDVSELEVGYVIEEGAYVMAGDFKIHCGIDIDASGLKSLKSKINTMYGIIEFTNVFVKMTEKSGRVQCGKVDQSAGIDTEYRSKGDGRC